MTTQDQLIASLQALQPSHLELVNESMQHAGYFEGKESHFKLTLVSAAFTGKRLVARHQQIYALVNHLLTRQNGSVHALAIHAYTPSEWQTLAESLDNVPKSPLCASNTTS